jgi:hypothetical protein
VKIFSCLRNPNFQAIIAIYASLGANFATLLQTYWITTQRSGISQPSSGTPHSRSASEHNALRDRSRYAPLGYPQGNYRVGPLARLNVCSHTGSPKSDKELIEFKQMSGARDVVVNSFYYHYARMIEILFAIESSVAWFRSWPCPESRSTA